MRSRSVWRVALVVVALVAGLGPLQGPEALDGLVGLAVRRLRLADEVAAAKYVTGAPVTDAARERRLLERVGEESAGVGLAPAIGVRFFRAQIEAGKAVQRGLHARWRADPASAPRRPPDLATGVRPRLDRLTLPMVRLLLRLGPLREEPGRCRDALVRAWPAARAGLDRLHRDALGVALAPLCAPEPAARAPEPPRSAAPAAAGAGRRACLSACARPRASR
ncbi:gamma subclass chorismate mutase AroQ [Actinomadura sp. ATCC 31491]|uniref:chorismate mutase n=1 Tax=Actinomadura luzonensis TaxID=2805427 RepID=A0ABT0FUY8_9ACTN|nr:gamma subclass chorismate mutase AroQ [Actinomadura luzonensis]MCK2216141.1 gamma subclass chorismate mutase AroQ [Actinomadura luzonensis]